MLITDVKRYIKGVAEKQVHVPTMIIGSMGIGKSQIVEQAAKELSEATKEKWGFVDLRLSTQEPGDLIGYPYIKEVKDDKGRVHNVTEHAKPGWFPLPGTKGLLFMDELNRAAQDVRQSVFQVIRERRLHEHHLPDGWHIVSAINPENGNYQVETLDKAMIRRFCCIKASTNAEIVMRWAKTEKEKGKPKMDDVTLQFLAVHPELLIKEEPVEFEQQPTPDGYTMCGLLRMANAIPKDLETEIYAGLIGREAAIAKIKFEDESYKKPVSGKDVLDNFDKVEKRLMKQKNDEWFVTLTELSAEIFAKDEPTDTRLENLVKFIIKAPPEIRATVMSKLPGNYLGEVMANRDVTKAVSNVVREARK
jgi:hypothetical protein